MQKSLEVLLGEMLRSKNLLAPIEAANREKLSVPLQTLIRSLPSGQQALIRGRFDVKDDAQGSINVKKARIHTKGDVEYMEQAAILRLQHYTPELEAIREIAGVATNGNTYSIDNQVHILASIPRINLSRAEGILIKFGNIRNLVEEYDEPTTTSKSNRLAMVSGIGPVMAEKIGELLEFAKHLDGTPPATPELRDVDVALLAKKINGALDPKVSIATHRKFKPTKR